MIDRLLHSCRKNLRGLLKSRSGAIGPQFAILAIPLVLAAGAAVDLSRVSNIHGQVQDIADSAALAGAHQFTSIDATAATDAQTAASKYVLALAPSLMDHPSVTMLPPVTGTSCNLSAPQAAAGAVVGQVCATTPISPNYIGTVQVAISYGVKTTIMAMATPSINTSTQATAQGGVARQVTVSVNNFNTSASDKDEIYYYAVPTNSSGVMLTGKALYEYDPTSDIANNTTQNSSTPILSNKAGFTNLSSISLQVPYGSRPAFAMYNTTGGVSGYGSNCYNQAQGALKEYFSTRTEVPTGATNTTQYHDYQAATFNTQPDTAATKKAAAVVKCSNSQGSPAVTVSDTTGTDSYTPLIICTSSCSSLTFKGPANYLYTWGSTRNPLQFGNLNRNASTGIPSGGTTDGAMVTDCSQGTTTYNWDDNGGTGDDNDFNDIVFSVNCQTTTSLNTSVRLLK